ncbi:hypothetical protein FRB94_008140 [Tulasnella sp. JGI-2019a]|nr:hypothetical protein FRB94_008140 [Tulasnella sp. JGI-2019a]
MNGYSTTRYLEFIMGQGGQIVLINGTPYTWTLAPDSTNSYQMATWSFPQEIKSGQAPSIYVEWKQGLLVNLKDSAGNATYRLQGTDHTFQVQARSSSNSTSGFYLQIVLKSITTQSLTQGSIVNLGWAHDGLVTFVLSGSDDMCGFSSTNGPVDWMHRNLTMLGNRQLRHICMPSTHDAGMSQLHAHTAFVSERNVLTQTQPVLAQLNLGSRYLDVRPVISAGKYTTGHYSAVDTPVYKGWQGGNGQTIQDIINDLNTFTAKNKELIILNMSHAYNTDAGNAHYPDFTQGEWDGLMEQLLGIQNLFVASNPSSVDLTTLALSNFLAGNRAAVVIIIEPSNISLGSYATRGFYKYSQFNAWNSYANTNDLNAMMSDQLKKMADNRQTPDQSYFLLSWTLTQSGAQAAMGGSDTSILAFATKANPQLGAHLLPACSKKTYPNILCVDGLNDTNVSAMALAINHLYGA